MADDVPVLITQGELFRLLEWARLEAAVIVFVLMCVLCGLWLWLRGLAE